jgi:hypothetical protein
MKKTIALLAFVIAAAILPCASQAAGPDRTDLDIVLYDSLVGAGIGALAGTATLAFMSHPGDHLERITQGAAIGLICGMAFGVYEIRPVLYSYTDHEGKRDMAYGLAFSMPLK